MYPGGLTDEDSTQLSLVDPDLGDQARAARTGYEKRDYVDDHAAQLGQMPVSLLTLLKYVGEVRDSLQLFVDTVLYRVREAHARLDALERGRLVDPKDAHGPLRTTTITAAPHTVPAGSAAAAGLVGQSLSADDGKQENVMLAERNTRIKELEARIVLLESRPITKDGGVWKRDVTYTAGDVVTHKNSGWICSCTHRSAGDGPDHSCFRLFVRGAR